jgi:hypothetical protein
MLPSVAEFCQPKRALKRDQPVLEVLFSGFYTYQVSDSGRS